MSRTRSRDGHVAGMPPPEVERVLAAALATGPRMTRAGARKAMARAGAPESALEALEAALLRLPGLQREKRGVYVTPSNWERLLRHRAWRITPRRLDIDDVAVLVRLLGRYYGRKPKGLVLLEQQLTTALEGLE